MVILPPPASLPERPNIDAFPSSSLQSDSIRRKRVPLPPQHVRAPDSGYFAPPSTDGSQATSYYPPRPAPSTATDLPNALPSAPRRQVPPQASLARESDVDRGMRELPLRLAPASASRGPSRFDTSPTSPNAPPRDVPAADRDAMDVDRVPPARPASHRPSDPARVQSGMYADRIADAHKEGLPRAPRAMSSRGGPPPRPYAPPVQPAVPSYPAARAPEPEQSGARSRPPPPQYERGDSWTQRRGPPDVASRFSRGPVEDEDAQSRRTDPPHLGPRNGLPERPVTRPREHSDRPAQLDTREPPSFPSRFPQRALDGPLAPVSGTNSVPIGNRRMSAAEQNAARSPVDRYRPLGGSDRESVPQGRSTYRPHDDHASSTSPTSPSSRYSAVDDVVHPQRGQYGVPSARSSSTLPRAPATVPASRDVEPPSGPRGDTYPRDAPRPPRQSRFGPESRDAPLPPPDAGPRIWMTREESESRSRQSQQAQDLPPASAARTSREDSASWDQYDAQQRTSETTIRRGRSYDRSS
ncbi:hypothetical protein OBBRIDRAFT_91202 [Obba rivulosa]|uniref:Uncharacterized protein n=1 Tax=Obba rivulosa TaxID=1052685 RepID=A0A8E2APS7_9APHY|nr:hypothetical protein OBBRIDRAFT_91202 [Obba rivulosa]